MKQSVVGKCHGRGGLDSNCAGGGSLGLTKTGVKPIGETPVPLGNGQRLITVRDPDGNFIELIGP